MDNQQPNIIYSKKQIKRRQILLVKNVKYVKKNYLMEINQDTVNIVYGKAKNIEICKVNQEKNLGKTPIEENINHK